MRDWSMEAKQPVYDPGEPEIHEQLVVELVETMLVEKHNFNSEHFGDIIDMVDTLDFQEQWLVGKNFCVLGAYIIGRITDADKKTNPVVVISKDQ